VGSHCFECVKAAQPPVSQRVRQRAAMAGPVVTKAIIALNVAVFVLTAMDAGGDITGDGGELRADLALWGPAIRYGEWWELYRLVTAGFVHFGLIHIAFNMVILYRFGEMLEPALGRLRFAGLYLASLLGGSFGALLLSPQAFTGGASGAVFVNLVITFVVPGISIGGHLGGLVGGFLVGAFMLRVPTTRRSVIDGVLVAAIVSALAVAGSVWAA
jgi:membrane associated rhomboid family serine protease